jgi:hypothetical protein
MFVQFSFFFGLWIDLFLCSEIFTDLVFVCVLCNKSIRINGSRQYQTEFDRSELCSKIFSNICLLVKTLKHFQGYKTACNCN